MEEGKVITSMTITYEDGTTKEAEKGAFINLADGENITIATVGMEGSDVVQMVDAVMLLGYQLGMFKDFEEDGYEVTGVTSDSECVNGVCPVK